MVQEIGCVFFEDGHFERVTRIERYDNGSKVIYTDSGKYGIAKVRNRVNDMEYEQTMFFRSVIVPDESRLEVGGLIEKWLVTQKIKRLELYAYD